MLKIVFGIAIVIFSTACGYYLAKKYRQRRHFLRQLREFNEQFINEISYYRRPIKDFLSIHPFEGEFQGFLQEYARVLNETNQEAQGILNLSNYTFLRENEKVDIIDYFMMLGKGDSHSQKSYFFSMRERLAKREQEAVDEGNRYENLYIKLGFLCGLFILILII